MLAKGSYMVCPWGQQEQALYNFLSNLVTSKPHSHPLQSELTQHL